MNWLIDILKNICSLFKKDVGHDINKNLGYLHQGPRDTDWMLGGESGITFASLITNVNWNPFAPKFDLQHFIVNGGWSDTNACTCFSCRNSLAAQGNRMLHNNEISASDITALTALGLIVDGKFSISARYIALVSNNDRYKGNTFVNVWDAIRIHPDGSGFGIVSEADCPKGNSVDEFYDRSILTPELIAKGKKAMEILQINYEFLPQNTCAPDLTLIKQHLQQAPLQIAASYCPGWTGDAIVNKCDCYGQHATDIFSMQDTYIDDFDSETLSNRKLVLDYPIVAVLKGVMTLKKPITIPAPIDHKFLTDMTFGNNNAEVALLQDKLRTLKDKTGNPYFPASVALTPETGKGKYGPITKNSVAKFQADNGITATQPGVYCWEETRAALNKN